MEHFHFLLEWSINFLHATSVEVGGGFSNSEGEVNLRWGRLMVPDKLW
jgi:hypothetical protein